MGYTTGEFRIALRAERHNGPDDETDNEAIENLRMEIEALIASDPSYSRVAIIGVSGGI